MTVSDALKELRIILDDVTQPYGWSDSLLKSYMDEGQDQFCEDTGLFLDASTHFHTVAGTATYTLEPNVIQVLDVMMATGVLYQTKVSIEMLLNTTQAPPTHWDVDSDSGLLRLYPVPDAVYTVMLKIWRRATASASSTGAFEIPARFHRAPVEYAAHKAYRIHDKELENKGAADVHYANYRQYVTDGKRAVDRRASYNVPVIGCAPQYTV